MNTLVVSEERNGVDERYWEGGRYFYCAPVLVQAALTKDPTD